MMVTRLMRYILGTFLILMSLNSFASVLPMPQMSVEANRFMMAMAETGYLLPMIATVEVICGIMLLMEATTPIALVLLAPVSLNIVAFHLALDPSTIGPGAFVAALNLILGIRYFNYYRPMFAKLFTERVVITDKEVHAQGARPVAIVN